MYNLFKRDYVHIAVSKLAVMPAVAVCYAGLVHQQVPEAGHLNYLPTSEGISQHFGLVFDDNNNY
jgi:hypothetical protein